MVKALVGSDGGDSIHVSLTMMVVVTMIVVVVGGNGGD